MTRVLFSEAGKNALKNKTSYTYDYRGLLVRKVTDDYVEYREYTPDGKLLFSEKGDETTDYIYKSNTVFAEVRNRGLDEEVYYHHTDNLGTTEAITDSNGNVVWEAEYEAFGSILNQNGTKVFTASFTGKMYDAETGMYYFNARWYDSEIGRFITEDPARDGIDWYAYCNNNPLRFLDPNGLESFWGPLDNLSFVQKYAGSKIHTAIENKLVSTYKPKGAKEVKIPGAGRADYIYNDIEIYEIKPNTQYNNQNAKDQLS